MGLARVILVIQVPVFAGFGLAYRFRPWEVANLNGILLTETPSVSNVRIYCGGRQIGLALFLLWALCERERMRAALVLRVPMQGCLALARLARPPQQDLPTNGELDDAPAAAARRGEGRDTPAQGLPEMAPGAPGER